MAEMAWGSALAMAEARSASCLSPVIMRSTSVWNRNPRSVGRNSWPVSPEKLKADLGFELLNMPCHHGLDSTQRAPPR